LVQPVPRQVWCCHCCCVLYRSRGSCCVLGISADELRVPELTGLVMAVNAMLQRHGSLRACAFMCQVYCTATNTQPSGAIEHCSQTSRPTPPRRNHNGTFNAIATALYGKHFVSPAFRLSNHSVQTVSCMVSMHIAIPAKSNQPKSSKQACVQHSLHVQGCEATCTQH